MLDFIHIPISQQVSSSIHLLQVVDGYPGTQGLGKGQSEWKRCAENCRLNQVLFQQNGSLNLLNLV